MVLGRNLTPPTPLLYLTESEKLLRPASQDIWAAAGLGDTDKRVGSGVGPPGLLLIVGSWTGNWTSPGFSKNTVSVGLSFPFSSSGTYSSTLGFQSAVSGLTLRSISFSSFSLISLLQVLVDPSGYLINLNFNLQSACSLSPSISCINCASNCPFTLG